MPTVIGTTQQSNFFQGNYGTYTYTAWNNEAWGFYCYNITIYVPTCGWKMILSSSMRLYSIGIMMTKQLQHQKGLFNDFIALKKAFDRDWLEGLGQVIKNCIIDNNLIEVINSLYDEIRSAVLLDNQTGEPFDAKFEVWDSTYIQQDYYTFIMSNVGYNADYTIIAPVCSQITLRGQFGGGNNKPDIYMNFYCVCTPTSSGVCESVPYNTIQSLSESTTTSATVVTEQSTAPDADALSTTLFPGQMISNPTQIMLSKYQHQFCYSGTSLTTLNQVTLLMDCCSYCLYQDTCVGVNYKVDNDCDLVHETFEIAPHAYGYDTNCQYWDVRWKR